jgi:hypothetical protein
MFAGKTHGAWLTRNQLEILDSIKKHGRRGVPLWYTDINLATIRSLAKRGYVDTRSRGRIVATRSGKQRLLQPWPTVQPTGDQKNTIGASGSNVAEIRPTASGEASVHSGLDNRE